MHRPKNVASEIVGDNDLECIDNRADQHESDMDGHYTYCVVGSRD